MVIDLEKEDINKLQSHKEKNIYIVGLNWHNYLTNFFLEYYFLYKKNSSIFFLCIISFINYLFILWIMLNSAPEALVKHTKKGNKR
jgi:hypothetical protein